MILRDPVHGLITFERDEERIVPELLATAEVQRLRRVRQLGVTSVVYPTAEHTRFSHAIGTAHVMTRLLARLRSIDADLAPAHRVDPGRAVEALAAALLHDVGHGPFSHLFEEAMPDALDHESWTERIVLDPASEVHRVLVARDPAAPRRVADLAFGRHDVPYLARAVSGTLDVDRCDYLLRDAHATGVRYGQYDLDWLLRSVCFAPSADGGAPSLGIDGTKGLVAIEQFVLARLFMFQQVYFHKATRAAEWMIRVVIGRAIENLRGGARLELVPPAIARAAAGEDVALGDYLELDDGVLTVAMHAWESARDAVLGDVAKRVRARALFKTFDLGDADASARDEALEIAREAARRAGLDERVYVGLDVAADTPYSDADDPLAVIGRGGDVRKPGDVSFLLGRLRGETVVRARLVFAPELRDAIERALAP